MTRDFRPEKVFSGGQTGVDRAALDAALSAGLAIGGFVPKGRKAEDGKVPARYPLKEADSEEYSARTELNVKGSDATLILSRGVLGAGTRLTWRLCGQHHKPVLVVDLDADGPAAAVARARAFLRQEKPRILNVAGPRESRSPGIYDFGRELLAQVFA